MGAQDRVRVMVMPGDQPLDLPQAEFSVCHGNSIFLAISVERLPADPGASQPDDVDRLGDRPCGS
jgi:hypothetical protein